MKSLQSALKKVLADPADLSQIETKYGTDYNGGKRLGKDLTDETSPLLGDFIDGLLEELKKATHS